MVLPAPLGALLLLAVVLPPVVGESDAEEDPPEELHALSATAAVAARTIALAAVRFKLASDFAGSQTPN
jgi:hypothetical protein